MASGIELPVNMKTETRTDASGTGMSAENGGTHPDGKLVQCASNCQDTVFEVGTSADGTLSREIDEEYVEVDIISPATNAPDDIMATEETVAVDSTEHSSSFSGSLSRAEDGFVLSDGEVDSQYHNEHMPGCCFPEPYGGLSRRKKRLTDHWKNFIQPLKWRCQWLELRIKEIQALARTYDKELAKYDERKQSMFDKFPDDAFSSKSLAYSSHIPRKKIMKRRKRRRIEEIVDLASYVTNHNVLSFAKKFPTDRTLAKDGTGDQAMANLIPSSGMDNPFRLRVCDSTMEEMLAKILMAQSHIQQLKARIEKVISENPGKFSSANGLSSISPGSARMISDEEPLSPSRIGQLSPVKSRYAASQLVSEGEPGHLLLPDHSIQDHGRTNALPYEVESTNQSKDGSLMNNWAAKEELLNSEKVGIVQVKSERDLESRSELPSPLEASNVNSSPSKTYMRKRKRRGSGQRWKSKRLSG